MFHKLLSISHNTSNVSVYCEINKTHLVNWTDYQSSFVTF